MVMPKKQLRLERAVLSELIARHGRKTTLIAAYDRVSEELDFLRGSCMPKQFNFNYLYGLMRKMFVSRRMKK